MGARCNIRHRVLGKMVHWGFMKGPRMGWKYSAVAVAAAGLLFAQASIAQDVKPAPAEPQWLTSFDKASAEAQMSDKPILAAFIGSDWCPWCMKLHQEVFDTKVFKDWAAKNVVLLAVDFPQKKAQDEATKKANADLAIKYQIEGFPTVIFMSADGAQLGRSGYQEGGPTPWINNAQKILNAKKAGR